jgi:hypothetical protein
MRPIYNKINQIGIIDGRRSIMKKTSMIKYLLPVAIIFIFLQCIFVSWAKQVESPVMKKETVLPAPALPAL